MSWLYSASMLYEECDEEKHVNEDCIKILLNNKQHNQNKN